MMKQEFHFDPVQYLMIFLRERPLDGIERFQSQIINNASLFAEGSSRTYAFSDCIQDDTKVKVLVTGDIELNDKNVFIGLKMAFPEWDFQHYPLNIQKLFLKRPSCNQAKEVGVLATIERVRSTEDSKWGLPCVIDLSPTGQEIDMSSLFEEEFSSTYIEADTHNTGAEDKVDLFGDFINKMSKKEKHPSEVYDEVTFDLDLELTDYEAGQEESTESSTALSEEPSFYGVPTTNKDLFKEEFFKGADSKEILKDYEDFPKASPFSESTENEPFDFSFLEDASKMSLSFDEMDLEERDLAKETFHTAPFYEDEEDLISPQFLEPEINFELEGNFEEIPDPDPPTYSDGPAPESRMENFSFERIKQILGHYLSLLSKRLQGFPLRKISLALVSLGIILILLSFGVKVFEPDYEANKKAAGVIDLYEWIIMNDLVSTDIDTYDLFDLWEDSSEYHQFWYWFDHEWSPKISGYKRIETVLGTLGGFILGPGIILLLIPVLSRTLPFSNKDDEEIYQYENTNKISLSFTTYNNDWSIVDTWSKEARFKIFESEGNRRLYRKKSGIFQAPILCLISKEEDQVQLEVWVSTRVPTMLIPILTDLGLNVLENKDGIIPNDVKDSVNKLLIQLGHPPMA